MRTGVKSPLAVAGAVNSSLHSYLIQSCSKADNVSLEVGSYYMANAGGRLAGSFLSRLSYQAFGLAGCLLAASAMALCAGLATVPLSAALRSGTVSASPAAD